jgi:hypothetical protein
MAQLPRGVQTRTNVGRTGIEQNLNGNNMTKFFLSLHILVPFLFWSEKRYQVKLQILMSLLLHRSLLVGILKYNFLCYF